MRAPSREPPLARLPSDWRKGIVTVRAAAGARLATIAVGPACRRDVPSLGDWSTLSTVEEVCIQPACALNP